MKNSKYIIGFILLACSSISQLRAEIKLSCLFSDHMVIQRNQPCKVFGTADAGEKVKVIFHGQSLTAKTDKTGDWQVVLPPFEYGGPFEMSITGKNSISISDILIGDVWVCSGQSNMQFALSDVLNPESVLADADHYTIRLLKMPYRLNEKPLTTVAATSWQTCNAENCKDFSAVGYFFGRHLNGDLKIPIGLIESAVGGSGIETWTSEASLSNFPRFQKPYEELRTKNMVEIGEKTNRLSEAWNDTLNHFEPGTLGKWYLPETDCKDWQTIQVPYAWDAIKGVGVGWFRREFELTEKEASSNLVIFLSLIQNQDETYLNGVKIGERSRYGLPRVYGACSGLLRKGKNVLVLKVYNFWGTHGFIGKADDMYVQTALRKIPLSGEWQFKVGRMSLKPFPSISHNDYPSLLFNGMLAPLTSFPIKGVIWYQGEQNTSDPKEYATLLPNMIEDWRKHWNIGDFPFLIVQLPNFMAVKDKPGQSNWAEFRESQAKALSVPETGMAITIDLGEADDIHPPDKSDVGDRLALIALKQVYGRDIVSSGPVFISMEIKDEMAVMSFTDIGKGLTSNDPYGYVRGFAVAGNDQKFYWAKAYINDNKVYVYCDKVKIPASIRYAWADNPEDANLRNIDGLPAAPFRTDNW